MRHLHAEQSTPHFAERAHVASLLDGALERVQLKVAEAEEFEDQALGVHDQLAAAAVGDLRAIHARVDQRVPARWHVPRPEHFRFVLVAQRQVQDEVEARTQPQLLQLARLHPACRMASISTSAPRGRPATPTAARDG